MGEKTMTDMEEKLAKNIRKKAKETVAQAEAGDKNNENHINALLERSAHYNMEKENNMPRNWANTLDYIKQSQDMMLVTEDEIDEHVAMTLTNRLKKKIETLTDTLSIPQPDEAMSEEQLKQLIERTERKLEKLKQMVDQDVGENLV